MTDLDRIEAQLAEQHIDTEAVVGKVDDVRQWMDENPDEWGHIGLCFVKAPVDPFGRCRRYDGHTMHGLDHADHEFGPAIVREVW